LDEIELVAEAAVEVALVAADDHHLVEHVAVSGHNRGHDLIDLGRAQPCR